MRRGLPIRHRCIDTQWFEGRSQAVRTMLRYRRTCRSDRVSANLLPVLAPQLSRRTAAQSSSPTGRQRVDMYECKTGTYVPIGFRRRVASHHEHVRNRAVTKREDFAFHRIGGDSIESRCRSAPKTTGSIGSIGYSRRTRSGLSVRVRAVRIVPARIGASWRISAIGAGGMLALGARPTGCGSQSLRTCQRPYHLCPPCLRASRS